MSPDELVPGAIYEVKRAFHTGWAVVEPGARLQFHETIYNREDGSWLYRFIDADRDLWLVEADPAALVVLGALGHYLQAL